ncbi:MAG: molybdate ABC transporter substrate-binding protein [Acidobacteriota bacterium]
MGTYRISLAGLLLAASVTLATGGPAKAATLKVAVASNFAEAFRGLAGAFEAKTGHRLVPVVGSTGKHYAQIVHGAPFDLFFAADVERPRRLEAEGKAVAGTRNTYAVGRLALWSADPEAVFEEGQVLADSGFRRLAIANPRLAPYGRAAKQVLEGRRLWAGLQPRLVRGENIAQTYAFVASGNAEVGFVALAQLKDPGRVPRGSYWLVPETEHDPIVQQAVVVRDSAAARELLAFVRSDDAQAILAEYGYAAP